MQRPKPARPSVVPQSVGRHTTARISLFEPPGISTPPLTTMSTGQTRSVTPTPCTCLDHVVRRRRVRIGPGAWGRLIPSGPNAGAPRTAEDMVSDNDVAGRPELFIEERFVDGARVVSVRGEIDHDGKDVLRSVLLSSAGAAPARLVVDLSGVPFMDSSGINVFVAAHQAVSGTAGWVRIAAAQEPVLRVLELVGVDAVITCHPTLEQALRP